MSWSLLYPFPFLPHPFSLFLSLSFSPLSFSLTLVFLLLLISPYITLPLPSPSLSSPSSLSFLFTLRCLPLYLTLFLLLLLPVDSLYPRLPLLLPHPLLLHPSARTSRSYHLQVPILPPSRQPGEEAAVRGRGYLSGKCFFSSVSPGGKCPTRFTPTETTPGDCSHAAPRRRRPSSQDQRRLKGSSARRPLVPPSPPLSTHRRQAIPHFCTVRRLLGRRRGEAGPGRSILFTPPADGGTKRG